jgi:hypothetical protein
LPEDRYVYLKTGEFFLDGVPVGDHKLKGKYGPTEKEVSVTIFKNTIVEDVTVQINLPEPILRDQNGRGPNILEWSKLDPPTAMGADLLGRRASVRPRIGVEPRFRGARAA